MSQVSAQQAFLFHEATGCSVARAADILASMEPLLRERVLQAASVRPRRSLALKDPIETDPQTAEAVSAAAEEAAAIVSSRGPLRRGSCHSIWREQARILTEKHGLVWFSPQQMNPGILYD
jgi:hypothetical protein